MEQQRFKIGVKTLNGDVLTFNNVKGYSVRDNLIFFTDTKTGRLMGFPTNSCQIEEVKDEWV